MNYYLDITLLPDAEANLGYLWKKVFQQVHIALVDNKIGANQSAVALSIADYGNKKFPLGSKLRLMAKNEEELHKLGIDRWLSRLMDYCHIKPIKPVPEGVSQHACFRRKAVKSLRKKAERRAEHLDKSYEDVLAYLIEEGKSNKSTLPFISVESQQSKSRHEAGVSPNFFLFIEQTLFDVPVQGTFDCYGLSKTATVPWF